MEVKKEIISEYSNNILEVSIKENNGIEELYNKMVEMFSFGEIETENTYVGGGADSCNGSYYIRCFIVPDSGSNGGSELCRYGSNGNFDL